MDTRSPFPAALPHGDPGFGPFDGEAIRAEANRVAAAQALRCVAAQIVILLAACLSGGFFLMITWHQLAVYNAALKNCAGV